MRIGGIGGGQLHKLRLLRRRLGAQLAQEVHGGRQRKLRRAQATHKVAAPNPPALFERLEDVINCAEPAGHILRRHRLPQQHAVAIEQLQRERMAAFCCCSPNCFVALIGGT